MSFVPLDLVMNLCDLIFCSKFVDYFGKKSCNFFPSVAIAVIRHLF